MKFECYKPSLVQHCTGVDANGNPAAKTAEAQSTTHVVSSSFRSMGVKIIGDGSMSPQKKRKREKSNHSTSKNELFNMVCVIPKYQTTKHHRFCGPFAVGFLTHSQDFSLRSCNLCGSHTRAPSIVGWMGSTSQYLRLGTTHFPSHV